MERDAISKNSKSRHNGNMWWLYVIETEKGRFYTGVTTDVDQRFRQHAGEIKGGAKFFRSDAPALLIYLESHPSRSAAQRAESRMKSLSRTQKEALVFG